MQSAIDLVKNGEDKPQLDSKLKEQIAATVSEMRSRLGSSYRNMDYWELIDDNSYELSLLLLDDQKAMFPDTWSVLGNSYKKIWRGSGSKGKKLAEVENLDILSDALGLSHTKHAVYLKGQVDSLKAVLEKEI